MAVGEPGDDLQGRAGISRTRWEATPASVKPCLASRWCSASVSTVVRTPSGRMPRSSHRPETPVPVPISTTARASRTEARKRSTAPPPDPIGETPTSSARARAEARTSSSATYSSAWLQLAGLGGVRMTFS